MPPHVSGNLRKTKFFIQGLTQSVGNCMEYPYNASVKTTYYQYFTAFRFLPGTSRELSRGSQRGFRENRVRALSLSPGAERLLHMPSNPPLRYKGS